ncbi:hypothetical protein [Streptomyces erythrochromogenes]|uniref:hypothetical protein n=1 Tax=Streptomyces erythrochromogenes TaxID=285574 RepID=UPI00368AAF43
MITTIATSCAVPVTKPPAIAAVLPTLITTAAAAPNVPIQPSVVEPLAERTCDLYPARKSGYSASSGHGSPQVWTRPVGPSRGSSAISLDVHKAVTESCNAGHSAAVSELGLPSDEARRLMDRQLPQAQAIDRLAQEAVDVPTSTHCGILRAIADGFRAVVSEVTATVALDTGFWFLWIRAESRIGTWTARLQRARPRNLAVARERVHPPRVA